MSDTSCQPRHLPAASKCGCFRSPELEFQKAPGESCNFFGNNLGSPRVSPARPDSRGGVRDPSHPAMKERHSPLKAEHVGRETLNRPLPQGRRENKFCSLSSTYCIPPGTKPQEMSQHMASLSRTQGSEGLERCCWPRGHPLRGSARAGFVARASAAAAQAQLLKEPFRRGLRQFLGIQPAFLLHEGRSSVSNQRTV